MENIVEGYVALLKKYFRYEPENVRIVAEKRLDICGNCTHGGWICGKCGCLLDAKVRAAKSRCPIGKW